MNDFDWTDLAACKGQHKVFFPDPSTPPGPALLAARQVCAGCPAFDDCVAWWRTEPNACSEGILFGYSEVERKAIQTGRMRFVDWRFTDWENPVSRQQVAARERAARKAGVSEVVNAYRIYEIEDPDERHAVIEAYRVWLENARCLPVSYTQAEETARQRADSARKRSERRPACPNGCEAINVARLRRDKKSGACIWQCYLCRAKIRLTPEEDARYDRARTSVRGAA